MGARGATAAGEIPAAERRSAGELNGGVSFPIRCAEMVQIEKGLRLGFGY